MLTTQPDAYAPGCTSVRLPPAAAKLDSALVRPWSRGLSVTRARSVPSVTADAGGAGLCGLRQVSSPVRVFYQYGFFFSESIHERHSSAPPGEGDGGGGGFGGFGWSPAA